jgi:hypothetical protein
MFNKNNVEKELPKQGKNHSEADISILSLT